MIENHFADNIRASRLKKRMSIEEIAEKAGTSTIHLSRIERGMNSPSLFLAWNICEALGENMDDLCRKVYDPELKTYNVGKRRKRLVNNGREK